MTVQPREICQILRRRQLDGACVEDQPQHLRQTNPLRLVEDDTAALL